MAAPNQGQGGQPRQSEQDSGSPFSVFRMLLKNYFFAIIGAAVVALLLRVYVMEAFRIPTDLMTPTLLPGDHIFVNKLAYSRILGSSVPHRGDVVIFSLPSDPTKDFIKRIIGLPGDRVEIRDSQVVLNGEVISKPMQADVYSETLDERTFQVYWTGALVESRQMMEVTVPSDHVLVLGDNRAKGQDSRTWGFLPVSALEGRASVIWFSMGVQDQQGGSRGVRWSRLFSRVN